MWTPCQLSTLGPTPMPLPLGRCVISDLRLSVKREYSYFVRPLCPRKIKTTNPHTVARGLVLSDDNASPDVTTMLMAETTLTLVFQT